jgi:hypothetical protein
VTDTSRVEVVGARELGASLNRAAGDLEDLEEADQKAGQLIKQRAQQLAPKVSGSLARSIDASTAGVGVTVGSDLIYAGVQEYGWPGHNIVAQPFLRPAAEDTDQWVQFYEDEAQRALSKVKGA